MNRKSKPVTKTNRNISGMDGLDPVLQNFIGDYANKGVVIWDFDGVIADTEPFQAESYRKLALVRGIRLPDGFFDGLIGKTENDIWEILRANHPKFSTESTFFLKRERQTVLVAEMRKSCQPYPFIPQIIRTFKEAGFKQYIVSNGERDTIGTLLSHWGLSSFFDRLPALDRLDKNGKIDFLAKKYPAVIFEDNVGYLMKGIEAGVLPVFVKHSMNDSAGVPEDVIVIKQN